MIVVDASALLEFLLQTPLGARVEARLLRDEVEFHVPHLVDVELVSRNKFHQRHVRGNF